MPSFPSPSIEFLARLGFDRTALTIGHGEVDHPEFPFRARLVRERHSNGCFMHGDRFSLSLTNNHQLGYQADNAPELKARTFILGRPRWERSAFRWWQAAVFRVGEFTAAKQAKEAEQERAKRDLCERLAKHRVSLAQFRMFFEAYTQPNPDQGPRVVVRSTSGFAHPSGWSDLDTEQRLAKCARVLRVLVEEGFIPPFSETD